MAVLANGFGSRVDWRDFAGTCVREYPATRPWLVLFRGRDIPTSVSKRGKPNPIPCDPGGIEPDIKGLTATEQSLPKELFVDAPFKGRTIDEDTERITFHDITNSVEIDVSLKTAMSKIVQPQQKTLIPLLVDSQLQGDIEEFYLDKKVFLLIFLG